MQDLITAVRRGGQPSLSHAAARRPGRPAIFATGPDGRIILFDPGAEAMLGYRATDLYGQFPDVLMTADELAGHADALGGGSSFADVCEAAAGAEAVSRVWRLVRRDGTARTVLMNLAALPEGCGHVAIAEDVSNKDRALAALVSALEEQALDREKLRKLDKITTDVVSTVSHELRTPIASIRGFTDLLEDGAVGELSAGQRDLVARIDQNARRLLALVEDLLTLAQVESHELSIDQVPCDLCEVVVRAHDGVAQILAGRRLDLRLELPDEPVDYVGDPVQLERMVHNLLTNALKFTPDGGDVRVELTADSHVVEVVVSDTGVGIPVEDQDRLFHRFYRADSSQTLAIQGTGLGLPVVDVIAGLHGGSILIESARGAGTRAIVTLPRTRVAPPVGAPLPR